MFCQVKQKYKNLDVKVATDKNVSVIFFASPFTNDKIDWDLCIDLLGLNMAGSVSTS